MLTVSSAACLLFAGRLADLYPPHRVFTFGFAGISITYLIISFMTNEIAFYVLRSISALLAVLTIPSAINMIVQMYPDPEEQAKKLGLFGMSGALANTIALVLAGVFLLANWRWYFRFITILTVSPPFHRLLFRISADQQAPFAVIAWFLMPKTEAVASGLGPWDKIKRMDLPGVGIMVASLILFVYGFTQAPMIGWSSAQFIAPFIISVVLAAGFIIYERFLPVGYSLLPHGIWSYPNIFPLLLQASGVFMWMATVQLRLATYFQIALNNSAILAAVKLLPMGVTALVVGILTQVMPWLITRPRYVQPIASVFCFVGSMLFAFSGGGHGSNYWAYIFTGEVIGTAGAMIIFISMNSMIIMSFPLESAGIGGSFANVIFQVGGVIGIAVQAGLIATGDGTVEDWVGSRNGYFFTSGYILATGLIFVLWYRQEKMPVREGPVVAV
jgi:MFS family permease